MRLNSTRKDTNSRLPKQQSKSESDDDSRQSGKSTKDSENLRHQVSTSLSQTVIAKVEPTDASSVFHAGEKVGPTIVESCEQETSRCDLATTIPRPESSGSSEVSGLQSDPGINFIREDEAFDYPSFAPNFIPDRDEADRCVVHFPLQENVCGDVSRLTCGRSPSLSTSEQITPWFQERVDPFSTTSVAPTNYPTVDPSYPIISANISAGNCFRNNSSCDSGRFEYAGYAYNQPCVTSAYISPYQHRPTYTSYDYPKF